MASEAFNPFLDEEEEELPTSNRTEIEELPLALPPSPPTYEPEAISDSLTEEEFTLDGFDDLVALPEVPRATATDNNPTKDEAELLDGFSLDEWDFSDATAEPTLADSAVLPLPPVEEASAPPVDEPAEDFDLDDWGFSSPDREVSNNGLPLPPIDTSTVSPLEEPTESLDLDDWDFTGVEPVDTPLKSNATAAPFIIEDDEAEWADEEDPPLVSDDDEFDFTSLLNAYELPEDEESETPTPSDDGDSLETDWGFLDEDTAAAPVPTVEDEEEPEVNWEAWGLDESGEALDHTPSFSSFPTEEELAKLDTEEVEEEPEEDLAAYLDQLSEGIEPEDPSEEETPAWKKKVQETIAQIKSELRGGDEAPPPSEKAPKAAREGGKPSIPLVGKILAPYTWLAMRVMKLLLLVLSPLKKIPGLGKFIGENVFFKTVSYILPLLILALILNWQGSKPLPPAKAITFPDGGAASIEKFGYDSKTNEAYATIVNEGEVIAEVTPTFKVYSIQPSLNPLSLFFAKPAGTCKGSKVEVPIEEKLKVKVKCEVKGSPKKITGAIKW